MGRYGRRYGRANGVVVVDGLARHARLRCGACGRSIKRAADCVGAAVQHMGVNLGGLDIFVAEQFLHCADVVARLEEVGGKAVAQRVGRDRFVQAGLARSSAHRALDDTFVQMEAVKRAVLSLGIPGEVRRGKNELPSPLPLSIGIFAIQRMGQRRASVSLGQVPCVKGFGNL